MKYIYIYIYGAGGGEALPARADTAENGTISML